MLAHDAPAKINLGLHVLRRRPDGFHDIETVFLRIGWADHITVEPAERLFMTCSDPDLPVDRSNLCMRAALQLADAFDVRRGAHIHLDKHIPYGAGLGGGSSDAATTLRLCAQLWDLNPAADRLNGIAANVGSDVAFFMTDANAAYATGRGEQLTLLTGEDGAPYHLPYSLVVVVPPVQVPTVDAYRRVAPHDEGRPDLRAVVRSNDMARWRSELTNDFERPIIDAFVPVGIAKELLVKQGADYAAMSGSGSAVFGVFTSATQARSAADTARAEGYQTYLDVGTADEA